jgi:hypothetical protein
VSYAILRTEKLKSWGNIAASGAHTARVEGFAPNADPRRAGRNRTLVGTPGAVQDDVRARVDAITDKPRRNAVLCVEHLLTASPEFFEGKNQRQIMQWAKANVDWLKERYGEENVAHVALHIDEKTPHLAAYIVPEKDGKLNARELFGTRGKMAQMQTEYAEKMRKFGLERGIEGSKAKHQKVKRWYGWNERKERQIQAEVKKLAKPTPPPEKRLFQSRKKRNEELKNWQKEESRNNKRLVELAGRSQNSVQILAEQVESLKRQNARMTLENQALTEDRGKLMEEVELNKDQIGILRKTNTTKVAERLGYFGEVGKKENAIDLVKRINEFDFQQAVSWLYHEFGPLDAAAAVDDELRTKPPERPFTAAENVQKQALRRQVGALGAERYRLSLIASEGDGAPYLPGKHGDQEHFYSPEELERLIPYLRYENNHGRHVYLTPMDDDAFFVLIDDLRISSAELEERGFKPCLVQQTSWASTQAVMKIPKGQVDRRAVIDAFNELNRSIGDEKITGLRHPIRMAGFRNMKPKHERDGKFPFVSVQKAENRMCETTLKYAQTKSRTSEQSHLPDQAAPKRHSP